MAKKPKRPFEGSKFDNDKGVTEGSPRDRERDRREKKRMQDIQRRKDKGK